jgi:hypothetical protein
MKLRYKIYLVVGVLATTYLFGKCQRKTNGPNSGTPPAPAVLPPDVKEQIVVNPIKHTLTIIKPGRDETLSLPDHPSTISLKDDGTIKITAPQFGTELRPFFGVFYSNNLRFGAGADFVYFKKLDLGIGGAGGSGVASVAFIQCGYVVWDNLKLGITYDTSRYVGVGISVRI